MKTHKSVHIPNFPIQLHREAKIAAAVAGIPLREWIAQAVQEKLEREQEVKS